MFSKREVGEGNEVLKKRIPTFMTQLVARKKTHYRHRNQTNNQTNKQTDVKMVGAEGVREKLSK